MFSVNIKVNAYKSIFFLISIPLNAVKPTFDELNELAENFSEK